MTQSDFFRFLGAPLANKRWSWGAVRQKDGAVFLRVWQDETKNVEGKRYIQIAYVSMRIDEKDSLGYAERIRHVEMVRKGARTYLVMCVALDISASPRVIKSFNREEVFLGGRLVESQTSWWIELCERLPIASVRI
jgi:hypothetical protein